MNNRIKALGRLKQGTMNRLELKYARRLDDLKVFGSVSWYAFEGMKFRLADKTFYTPDFMVMLVSGELEAHEVKGFWQDDARVKIKVAAEMYPIQFIGVTQKSGIWEYENF